MRVLILDGQSRAALECAQSLGRRGAYVALACEADDCIAFHSRYVHERLRQPAAGAGSRALEWLRSRHAQHPYDLIIPSTDLSLQWLHLLAEADAVRMRAVLPGSAALEAALDRQSTYERAAALGIPVPSNVLLRNGGSDVLPARYPVVLKATRSPLVINGRTQRVDPVVARSREDRERVLARWLRHTPVQQQEYVPGRGFGIELLFERGRLRWHFAHERVHEQPLSGGGSTYRRSIKAPRAMLERAAQLLRSLGWHGAAMVDFRGPTPEEARLVEVKPRLWGSLALSIDCGVDFPWGLALLALGQRLPGQPRYRVGYYTRDLLNDAKWQVQNWRADHADPLLHTRSRLAAAIELLRPLVGRESWDHFDWRDLGATAHSFALGARALAQRMASRLHRRRWRRRALRQHRALLRSLERNGRPERLLFICHGNTCGSPLAAQLARRRVGAIDVRSAGLHRAVGWESPPHLRKAAKALGIDLSAHRSRRLAKSDVDQADLILCMDVDNLLQLQRLFPHAVPRATLLGLFASPRCVEIPDACELGETQTRAIAAVLQSGIENLAEWLATMPRVRLPGLRSPGAGFRLR